MRILSMLLGSLLLYSAIFLREDEEENLEKSVRNLIEDIWIEVDDRVRRGERRFIAISSKVAEIYLCAMERVFGKKTLSIQSISVAVWMSFASIMCSVAFLGPHYLLGVGWLFMLIALLPALVQKRWVVALLFVLSLMFTIFFTDKSDGSGSLFVFFAWVEVTPPISTESE